MNMTIYGATKRFSMGSPPFTQLRIEIANLFDKDYGKLYKIWRSEEEYKLPKRLIHLHQLEQMAKEKALDKDVVDFLMLSEHEGIISHTTCEKLLTILKDNSKPCPYSRNFVEILEDCIVNKEYLEWM